MGRGGAAALAQYRISKDPREALATLEPMLKDSQQYSKGYAAYYLSEMGLGSRAALPALKAEWQELLERVEGSEGPG